MDNIKNINQKLNINNINNINDINNINIVCLVFVFVFIIGIVSLSFSTVYAANIYVDPVNGNDVGSGNDTSPFKTISHALTMSADGGTIYLSPGNYNGSLNTGLAINKNINIKSLYSSNRAVLDGQNTGVSGFSIGVTGTGGSGGTSGGSGSIFNVLIENVNFTNGNGGYGSGGAIISYGNLTLVNSSFIHNTAFNAGAIFTQSGSSLNIIDSLFSNNSATNPNGGYGNGGGAIFNYANYATISNTLFKLNTAIATGGAIYNRGENLNVSNSSFVSNHINNPSWGAGGGAIMNDGSTGGGDNLALIDSYFYNNSAAYYGGAVYNYESNNLYILNSKFINNVAQDTSNSNGGAIRDNGADFTVINSTFINNSAAHGGAIHTTGTTSISGSNFENNTASANDGTSGGALYLGGSDLFVINYNRFYHNNASISGANSYQIFSETTSANVDYNWWGNNTNNPNYAVVNSWGGTFNPHNYIMVNVTPVSPTNVVYNIFLSDASKTLDASKLPLFYLLLNVTAISPKSNSFDARANGQIIEIADDTLFSVDDWNNNFQPPLDILDVYVNATGGSDEGSHCGYSWDAPLKTIAKALELVADGGIIHIAGGGNIYDITTYESTTISVPLMINKNITLQGYTMGVDTTQAIWGGNGTGSFGAGSAIIDGQYMSISYRSMFNINPGLNVTINNLTFINAKGENGSVIYLNGSNLTVNYSNFTNNIARNSGAIYSSHDSILNINNSVFNNNSAINGGAIYNNGLMNLNNLIFTLNYAHQGGAIYANVGSSNVLISSSNSNNKYIFRLNNATNGGAIYSKNANFSIVGYNFYNNGVNDWNKDGNLEGSNSDGTFGGAIAASDSSNITITNSNFYNNSGSNGGAIFTNNSNIILLNSINNFNNNFGFINSKAINGGAIYSINSYLNLTNINLNNNTAFFGAAIFANQSIHRDGSGSGGFDGDLPLIHIFNSSIRNNNASIGAIYGIESNFDIETVNFTNNIASNSAAAFYITTNSNLTIVNSIFNNNTAKGKDNTLEGSPDSDVYGGAIYLGNNSYLEVDNSLFNLNNILISNINNFGYGGAIYINESDFNITNSNFTRNILNNSQNAMPTNLYGGAIYINGNSSIGANGNLDLELNHKGNIRGSIFNNNTAIGNGGAIYLLNFILNVNNSIFTKNNVNGYETNSGGAFYLVHSNLSISYSFIYNNSAVGSGGAIYSMDNVNLIVNSTDFAYNTAVTLTTTNGQYNGGAIYIGTIDSNDKSNILLNYNRFYHNNLTATQYQVYYNNASANDLAINAGYNWWGNATNDKNYAVIGTNRDNLVSLGNDSNGNGYLYPESFINLTVTNATPDMDDGEYIYFIFLNGTSIDDLNNNLTGGLNSAYLPFFKLLLSGTPAGIYPGVDISTETFTSLDARTNKRYINVYDIMGLQVDDWKISLDGGYDSIFDVYVNAIDGFDGNNGTSWDNPLKTISAALSRARHNATIHIAGGNYNYNGTGINVNILINKNITILGYTVGVNTSVDNGVNDGVSNPTNSSGFGSFGVGEVYIDGTGSNGLFTLRNVNVNLINLTFVNGNINLGSQSYGAALNLINSFVNITNSKFINNTVSGNDYSGGAIYVDSRSNISLNNGGGQTGFYNNSAAYGGAIYYNGNTHLDINGIIFENNTASSAGGAIYNRVHGLNISNSKFILNHADGFEPGSGGGAIYNIRNNLTIFNSSFINNSASNIGGAVYTGSFSGSRYGNNSRILNSIFTNNSASSGGAVFNDRGINFYVSNSNFTNNTATSDLLSSGSKNSRGGAIVNNDAKNFLIYHSSFNNNSATDSGGAIFTIGANAKIDNNTFILNSAAAGGGVFNGLSENLTVSNSTFNNNSAKDTNGGGVHNVGRNLKIINSIFDYNFANNYGGALYNVGNNTIISNSNFTGNNATNHAGAFANRGYNDSIDNSRFINNTAKYGAAVCNNNSGLKINNSYFYNNSAEEYGGAIYTLYSNESNSNKILRVYNSNFTLNYAKIYGGAIISNYNLNIYDSNFENNSASYGGGLYINCSATINSSKFINNTACSGAAIYGDWNNNITISYSNFTLNNATGVDLTRELNGTGGGAIYLYFYSNLNIDNSNFDDNSAEYGGVIWAAVGSNINLINSKLNNNSARQYGGAIRLRDVYLNITNTNLTNNIATECGGAIYSTSLSTGSNIYLNNLNFINNSATIGGGGAVYANASSNVHGYSSNYVNNTAAEHGGAFYFNGGLSGIYYNRFYNNNLTTAINPQVYVNSGSVNLNYNWWGHNITEYNYAVVGTNDTSPAIVEFRNHVVVQVNPISKTKFNYTISLNTSDDFNSNLLPNDLTLLLNPSDSSDENSYDGRDNMTIEFTSSGFKTFKLDDWEYVYITNDLYVNSSIDHGNYDGSNWDNAFKNLSAALDVIVRYAVTNAVIHIAGDDSTLIQNYTGEGINTNIALNNSFDNLTLSGEFGSPVFDAQAISRIFNITANNLTISNITFVNGNASGFGEVDMYGGAIYNEGNNTNIINSSFINNSANSRGGAIYNAGSDFSVSNSSFVNNSVDGRGGAIYNAGSNIDIINSSFINNHAYYSISGHGGAIYNGIYDEDNVNNRDFNLTIINSSFINNSAEHQGGAIENDYGVLIVNNSEFINNSATFLANAIYSQAITNGDDKDILTTTIDYSSFSENNGAYGAIMIVGNFNLSNSNFTNNNNGALGLQIHTAFGEPELNINNNNISSNDIGIVLLGMEMVGSDYVYTIPTLTQNNIIDKNQYALGLAAVGFEVSFDFIVQDNYAQSGDNNTNGVLLKPLPDYPFLSSIINSSLSGYSGVAITIANSSILGRVINSNITNNGIAILVNGNNSNITSNNILNNSQGIIINNTAYNTYINYNRLVNNSNNGVGVYIENDGHDTNLNSNWWGQNNITGIVGGDTASYTFDDYFVLLVGYNNSFVTYVNASRDEYTGYYVFSYYLGLNTSSYGNIHNTTIGLLPAFIVNVSLSSGDSFLLDTHSNSSFESMAIGLNKNNSPIWIKAAGDNEDPILKLVHKYGYADFAIGLYVNSSWNNSDGDGTFWDSPFKTLNDALLAIVNYGLNSVNSNFTIHIAGDNSTILQNYTANGVNVNLVLNSSYSNLTISGEFGSPVFDGLGLYRIFNITGSNITIAN
ncbi:MAG: hypothetical protein LBM96_08645, partial [Methanobrevibacter sp.]|nr:hypothetical protein [Candidatus Methanoflexus mossambicus]